MVGYGSGGSLRNGILVSMVGVFVAIARADNVSHSKVVKKSETRFYAVADEVHSIWCNKQFITRLYLHPSFQEYLESCQKACRDAIDKIFTQVDSVAFWCKVKFAMLLFQPIKEAVQLVSRGDFPMSSYYLIVFATKTRLEDALAD